MSDYYAEEWEPLGNIGCIRYVPFKREEPNVRMAFATYALWGPWRSRQVIGLRRSAITRVVEINFGLEFVWPRSVEIENQFKQGMETYLVDFNESEFSERGNPYVLNRVHRLLEKHNWDKHIIQSEWCHFKEQHLTRPNTLVKLEYD